MTVPVRIVLGVTIAESLKLLGPLPQSLSDAGWEVHLVSNPVGETQVEIPTDVSLHSIPMVRRPSIAKDLLSLLRWIKLLSRVRPTIVSVGTPKASMLGIFAAWVLQVPRRVYVLRGLRLETTRGPSRWVLKFFERITAGCSTHVLAVSDSLASKYVELGLCAERKITVIGSGSSHGVNIARFSSQPRRKVEAKRAQLGLAPGLPVLGFVGRFSKDKGAEEILATRKELVKNGIDHEILVVGPVEDSPLVLEELNTLGRHVKHVGEVSNVEDFYPLMTLLLLPTKREGFPNVVLEAAAAGIPTVTTTATGAVDSVVQGKTGLLVDTGADRDFALAVRNLIRRPTKINELRIAACKRVHMDFDEREVIRALATYYTNLLR